jgi:molecular chaperone DnaJ
MDYYKILGVDKGASQDEIKKAFRKKAHEYHPDKATGDEAKFKEANEAYQVLGDEKKRAQYDQFGSAGFQNGQAGGGFGGFSSGGINMDDLGDIFGGFGDIFGGFGGGSSRRPSRGHDIQTILVITFEEAVHGVEKEVSLRRQVKCDRCNGEGAEPGAKVETCSTCRGTGKVTGVQRTILGNMQVQSVCPDCQGEGKTFSAKCNKCSGTGVMQENSKIKVKIPAGIDDGETIRLSGQGEAGQKGAPSGDLYLKISVRGDSKFERYGYDIHSKAFISFTQAALGDKIDIETINGSVKLKIPAGTQSGTNFKLRGKGVQRLRGSGKGDHIVKVQVQTPTNLNKKQKELLKELEK